MDDSFIRVEVEVNTPAIQDKLSALFHDDRTMLEIHNLLAKTIDPWVPYLSGPLSQTVDVQPEYIRYVVPYAHYQYYGVGFNHTIEVHPLASAMWDKVAMQTMRESFEAQVKDILVRRAKELYG